MFKLRSSLFPATRSLNLYLLARFAFPKHELLSMPALSPTMTEGKILKWLVKVGDKVQPGDAIAEVETDKATMAFQVQEKGFIAKLNPSTDFISLGTTVAVIAKSSADASQFSSFSFQAGSGSAPPQSTPTEKVSPPQQAPTQQTPPPSSQSSVAPTAQGVRATGDRVVASPLAKTVANQKGIDLSQVTGSGPNGRIIKQDVEGYVAPKPVVAEQTDKKTTKKGFVAPENPFEDIALTSMRKTIANRLSESKQTIPHYYITTSIEMGSVNVLRNELNKNEKQHGVKISVNDIIIKAMALALRDLPNVNVQWQGNAVRRFKYADISVAVAIDGGLITPIVHKADTLGLLDIARRTKDIAKRAREGKLDPNEYIGGTTTVSNLGMFGINTVSSIINPPQATILGVGKTEKKIVFAQGGPQPYRVAEIMDVIASCDHRAVDGALAAQWLNRIKHYLETPTHMLL